MNMRRNPKTEEYLFGMIKNHIVENGKNRPYGIHVSDLINPLRAFHNKMHPTELTDDEINRFFSGNAFEEMVSKVLFPDSSMIHSESGVWNGIHYEIDFFDKSFQYENPFFIPNELKSTLLSHRYKTIEFNADIVDNLSESELMACFPDYVKQIKKYMVIKNSNVGNIIIYFWQLTVSYEKSIAFGKRLPQLRTYEINMTGEELLAEKESMLRTKNELTNALVRNDPSALDCCPEWMCKICPHFNVNCKGTYAQKMAQDPSKVI